jgi:hypothetical protein
MTELTWHDISRTPQLLVVNVSADEVVWSEEDGDDGDDGEDDGRSEDDGNARLSFGVIMGVVVVVGVCMLDESVVVDLLPPDPPKPAASSTAAITSLFLTDNERLACEFIEDACVASVESTAIKARVESSTKHLGKYMGLATMSLKNCRLIWDLFGYWMAEPEREAEELG